MVKQTNTGLSKAMRAAQQLNNTQLQQESKVMLLTGQVNTGLSKAMRAAQQLSNTTQPLENDKTFLAYLHRLGDSIDTAQKNFADVKNKAEDNLIFLAYLHRLGDNIDTAQKNFADVKYQLTEHYGIDFRPSKIKIEVYIESSKVAL
ncbi:hypothetical protein KJ628_05175 [Patescibacteria group bacterium]|nr:hypothetical protein [Patescibacteria group bacterium]